MLSFRPVEFWPYCFKHWNCDLILPIIGILVLPFRTLELWPYPYKHCTSYLIFPSIGILALFYTLWKTLLILPNIGILAHFMNIAVLILASFTSPCFQISGGIPHIPGTLPLFVALMASNTFLNSGFLSRYRMFGLRAVVSKAERSTSPVMLSILLKQFVNLSRSSAFSCISLIIKVRKLCCIPPLWPLYFSQTIFKRLSYLFFCYLLQFFSLCLPPLRICFPGILLQIPSCSSQFCSV